MKKPDKDLQQLLTESVMEWLHQKQVEHTDRSRAAFQDAFEAGWHTRDRKQYKADSLIESMKKEIERLETLLVIFNQQKDRAEGKNLQLQNKLESVEKAMN